MSECIRSMDPQFSSQLLLRVPPITPPIRPQAPPYIFPRVLSSSSPALPAATNNRSDDVHRTLQALRSKNRVPKKWLGQHYMVNQEVNERLIQAAHIDKDDLILEIGPGTGSLTNHLVESGAHVVAVEKDPAMADLIHERFQTTGQVEVVQEDFMKWPIRSSIARFLTKNGASSKTVKVVSNLPFNITTPVIKRILPMGDIFSSMVLLIQEEAAARLVDASPHSHDYRPMSLFVQFFSDASCEFKVSRKNFFPQPKVDAAVVSFRIKHPSEYPSVNSARSFFTLVNSAFSGKRKMLRNSLQHLYPNTDIQAALKSQGLLETARPDQLSLDQFVSLYSILELSEGRNMKLHS